MEKLFVLRPFELIQTVFFVSFHSYLYEIRKPYLYISFSSTDFEVISLSISASDFEVAECWGYNRFFRLDLLVSAEEAFSVLVSRILDFCGLL